MYESGVGAQPDKDRAKLWADESREMFQFSASFGIKDPNVAKMVDSILNNDELIAAVVGEEKVEETKKNLKKAAELFQKLRGMFGGDGGKATVDAIEKQRLSIVRDLQEASRNRNARDRLNRMEETFRKLSAEYGADAKPTEFDEVAALVTRARQNIELGVQPPAIRALEEVGVLLQAIKAQAPEPPDSKKRP
jgi:flagellin-specific chaperone FliS